MNLKLSFIVYYVSTICSFYTELNPSIIRVLSFVQFSDVKNRTVKATAVTVTCLSTSTVCKGLIVFLHGLLEFEGLINGRFLWILNYLFNGHSIIYIILKTSYYQH